MQPRLGNYSVSLKHVFPAFLVPPAKGTFPQLLSEAKVPLTSPLPQQQKEPHAPKRCTYSIVLRIRKLTLGHQGGRR